MLKISKRPTVVHSVGFTLVELLTVFAIIAVLLSLIVPAVQSVRESARRISCANNLRQVSTALQAFHSLHGRFPTNGWGFSWIGEPGRAAGESQPGGWIYQSLPQIGEANAWRIGEGLSGSGRLDALKELCRIRIPVYKCPSRPAEQLGPQTPDFAYRNTAPVAIVSRTDYAINEGDFISNTNAGPMNLAEGDSDTHQWKDVREVTGISWLRGSARISDVVDGSSNTYLVGEKYVSRAGYAEATDKGHDQSMLSGVDVDLSRWVESAPLQDSAAYSYRAFGSAHLSGFQMSFCDGSVRTISYKVDSTVHRNLGNRLDGN